MRGNIYVEEPTRHQLADDGTPLQPRERPAHAEGRQEVVAVLPHLGRVLAAQHIGQMGGPKPLAGPVRR